jgi:hypothetical protein
MIDLYSDSISDKEIEALHAKEVSQEWLENTPEGRQFNRQYNSEQNRAKLAQVFDLLDEAVTPETLSGAFRKLVASGALRTEQQIKEAADQAEQERDRANRAKWESECEAWLDSHSTQDVKARAERDRAFASWLQKHNEPPVVQTGYDPRQLARQRREQKAQREKDKPYLDAPEELRSFAESYRRMSFAEVQQRIRDPQFRAQIEMASKHNLI